ncbi:MAG: thiamine pyrophosphate-dependent enzyme, partial [Pontibacterium sp.]
TGHKMIVVVCDNEGYAVINRLQEFKGTPGFNNLLKDCRIQNPEQPLHVDFVKHAEAMGAYARKVDTLDELEEAMQWAQNNDKTTLINIVTDAFAWVPGDADWDVGVPEVSDRDTVKAARAHQDEIRAKQRVGV